MSRYFITTFGCQANFSDSERIASALEAAGLKKAKNENRADVLVFNTCSVRQSAEDRIFGLNKKFKNLKAKNLKLKTVLAGCMNHYDKKGLKKRLPYIDVFLPIKDLAQLPNLLKIKSAGKNVQSVSEYLSFTPKYESKFRAFVPISSGCNNFCSYCIVPYSRGKEKSRAEKEIISEVKNLVKNNYKEIWLLGQNVNNWTYSLPRSGRGSGFSELLKTINDMPGDFWIRFTSPHPKPGTKAKLGAGDFSWDKLIKTMAECEKVTEYLNLPVQSGDNRILKEMNRPYTVDYYASLVEKIRKAIPEIAISTDIIVGFPGETEKQFQNTARLLEEIKFDMAYISEYSPRPGTLAARKFKDNIPPCEKIRRKKYLTAILAKTAFENNKKLIGKTFDVLIDEKKEGRFFGRTRGNKVVELLLQAIGKPVNHRLSDSLCRVGKFAKVKISKAEPWKLKGMIVQ